MLAALVFFFFLGGLALVLLFSRDALDAKDYAYGEQSMA